MSDRDFWRFIAFFMGLALLIFVMSSVITGTVQSDLGL